jgi:hypothetical protein
VGDSRKSTIENNDIVTAGTNKSQKNNPQRSTSPTAFPAAVN